MNAATLAGGKAAFVWGLWRSLTPAGKQRPVSRKPMTSSGSDLAVAANGKKILLVDDDAVILETTSLRLRHKGYAVVAALDASEAIGAVRDEKPDVILLDLTFPPNVAQGGAVAWDGFVLMSWLRQFQDTRSIPIIIITGQQTEKLQERLLRAGARAFFPKPIDHERLLPAIRRALGEDTEAAQAGSVGHFQI